MAERVQFFIDGLWCGGGEGFGDAFAQQARETFTEPVDRLAGGGGREAQRMVSLTNDPAAPRAMAAAHRAVANALAYLKQLDESRREYLEGQRILGELVKTHPTDRSLTHELADFEMSLGSLAEEQKDYPRMLEHFAAWHAFIEQRYTRDDQMYSYSAFRMGVAMVKCNRPDEAVPFLTDAIRLAERQVADQPGVKGHLNHLAWCLRVMAQAFAATGDTVKAAEFRNREAAANAKLEKLPQNGEKK